MTESDFVSRKFDNLSVKFHFPNKKLFYTTICRGNEITVFQVSEKIPTSHIKYVSL